MSRKSVSFFYFLSSILFIVHFVSAGCVTNIAQDIALFIKRLYYMQTE